MQPPLRQQAIGNYGYFNVREIREHTNGIIVGAPDGGAEPAAAEYADWISEKTGAGFVIAYGFAANRLSVVRPLVRSSSYAQQSDDVRHRGTVYAEFKQLLQKTAGGKIRFYLGIRSAANEHQPEQIEVETAGLTFEQIKALKQLFLRIRDQALADGAIPKISIAMEPLEKISSPVSGIKPHGVLMIAEKGLNLRLPKILAAPTVRPIYKEILSLWITEALKLVQENPLGLPDIQVRLMNYGRIESIPSRKHRKGGVVIAAPHGTFDEHTAEVVKAVGYRTGLPAIIATGFTPTECGGWRINVNRPSERGYPSGEIEINTQRAEQVYKSFKDAVLKAADDNLTLYIDIHQNGQQRNIEVASVGISKEEAKFIKRSYREVRDQVLRSTADLASVDLMIEPLDVIEIGAWPAKAQGMLSVAKKSLHFEFPLYSTLEPSKTRDAYKDILALLLTRIVPRLANTR